MEDSLPPARVRQVRVTAGCSAVLVVAVAVGYALLGGDGPGFAVGTVTAGPEKVVQARSAPAATGLPVPVPQASATPTARPRRPVASRRPVRSAADRAVAVKMPSAQQRDRELAALLARTAGLYDDIGDGIGDGSRDGSGTTASLGTEPDTARSAPGGATAGRPPATPAPAPAPAPSPAPAAAPPKAPTAVADFRLTSFNVLGSSHTRNGARGRRPGVVRIRGAVQLLARHDVDVAGFQELQHDQARELLRVTAGTWALYPGPRAPDSDNSIGWRTSQFRLLRTTLLSVPYFEGRHRKMPVVLLQHRTSGVTAWFANVHNPAETRRYRHQQRWRTEATHIQAALANRLARTGVPLLLTGDMNERSAYFCRLTGAAPSMVAARGGSNGAGGCRAGAPRAVDWIFGSRGIVFSDYTEDRSDLVDVTTDHPVIAARARVDTATFPRAATRSR